MANEELPLPNYDELPTGTLRHRIRALTQPQLVQLLEHERHHANRAPVVTLLSNRLDQLEHGASPSPGSQEEMPEIAEHKRGGSPVTPSGPSESGRPVPHGTRSKTGKGAEHTQ